MNIKLLKSEADYDKALERVDVIFDAVPGMDEGDELELLLLVIKEYEDKHHPVPLPDPIEAIRLTMEEKGIRATDLKEQFGVSKSYISQILSRKKPLTADLMRAIHKHLGIPADVLLG